MGMKFFFSCPKLFCSSLFSGGISTLSGLKSMSLEGFHMFFVASSTGLEFPCLTQPYSYHRGFMRPSPFTRSPFFVFWVFTLECFFSVSLRVLFTFFQAIEYIECKFSMMRGTFGSIFFLATGFHRAHVFIGTSFLLASFLRGFLGDFNSGRFVGLLACIWYWHFVDVIWIFLYMLFYASYYTMFN